MGGPMAPSMSTTIARCGAASAAAGPVAVAKLPRTSAAKRPAHPANRDEKSLAWRVTHPHGSRACDEYRKLNVVSAGRLRECRTGGNLQDAISLTRHRPGERVRKQTILSCLPAERRSRTCDEPKEPSPC